MMEWHIDYIVFLIPLVLLWVAYKHKKDMI